jgi:glucosyl-3-phosphoglycerate synthase
MSDFHQSGVITTLHRLGALDLARLERQLLSYSRARPIALVLPCLFSEIRGPGLKGIVDALRGVRYLRQVVVSLGGTSLRADYEQMRDFFDGVRTLNGDPPILLWNDGPRVQQLFQRLSEEGLDAGSNGKGRSTWLAYGYVLSTNVSRVIAVHDCDIRDYSREMLARLCYPTANPNLHYEFAKGYYSRVTERLYRARHALVRDAAAARSRPCSLASVARVPRFLPLSARRRVLDDRRSGAHQPDSSDWGLEVGLLVEVYRNCSPKRICRVELTDNYDHKHQELSESDATRGCTAWCSTSPPR